MTGDELQQARRELGLSGSQFARVMEVATRTLRAWESGSRDGRPCPVPAPIALLTEIALKSPDVRRRLGIDAIKRGKAQARKRELQRERRRARAKARRAPRSEGVDGAEPRTD